MNKVWTILICSSAMALALASTAARAAEPAADAKPPAATDSGGLEEIVVTARKRTESLQDVPVSVTAISAQTIERRDLSSLERVAAATPQLSITRSATNSGAQIRIRGIGPNSQSIGLEQSVAVIVDGVYYGQGRIINEGFLDLAGIEILKGPQSLFYGKNATAGVISINSANPGHETEVKLRGGYEFNARQVYGEAIVSVPLTDRFGVRLAVRASRQYGSLFDDDAGPVTYQTRNTVNGVLTPGDVFTNHVAAPASAGPKEREFIARGTARWEATDRLTATLKASYSRSRVSPPAWNDVVYACQGGVSTLNPAMNCTRDFSARMNDLPATIAAATTYARDGRLYNDYEAAGVTGTVDWTSSSIAVTSVSNYQWNNNKYLHDLDFQSSATSNLWGLENTSYSAASTELRILSKFQDSALNFLIGGYYQTAKRDYNAIIVQNGAENSNAPPGLRFAAYVKDSQTKGNTASIYGQLIWKILPVLEATGGIRFIHETKNSFFVQPYVNPRFTNLSMGRMVLADQTFENWSPEATLSYRPTSNINIYAAYRTAYKSGGFSNSSNQAPTTPNSYFTFEPEKAHGFEGGVKTTLLDRQLRVDVGVYHYIFDNLQIAYVDAKALSYRALNVGSGESKGIEAEAEFAPRSVPGLRLDATANYNKAQYLDFIAPCYAGQTIAQGCSLTLSTGSPGQDLSGVPTSVAPRWTGSMSAELVRTVSSRFKLGGSVNAKYSSSYLPAAYGTALSRQPAYVTIDASIRLATSDDRWELALIGKNLTNRFIVTGAVDNPLTGSGTGTNVGRTADQVGQVAMPATVQLQLTWRM
ncbi:MAG: TonB-dependent receptor [Novosphingobium sp.]|nr:TonB-dependent receptor [Novosphingobium sp.]